MTRKAGFSVDVEVDANNRAYWELALLALQAMQCPTVQKYMGAKTSANGWDNGTEYDLTATSSITPAYVYLSVRDNAVLVVADSSADDPAAGGAEMPAGQTHKLCVLGMTKLHFKSAVADAAGILGLTILGS